MFTNIAEQEQTGNLYFVLTPAIFYCRHLQTVETSGGVLFVVKKKSFEAEGHLFLPGDQVPASLWSARRSFGTAFVV